MDISIAKPGVLPPEEKERVKRQALGAMSDCLSKFILEQDGLNREAVMLVASQCMRSLLNNWKLPISQSNELAVDFWLSTLAKVAEPKWTLCRNPQWLSDDAWASILSESHSQIPSKEMRARTVYKYTVDSALHHLKASPTFLTWVEDFTGKRVREVSGTYLYYDSRNQYCPIHLDNSLDFEYNCLIALRVSAPPHGGSSTLRIFEKDFCSDIALLEREAVLFQSSCIPHGRSPLAHGEAIHLLSIGLVCE
jgi:hypothetical protein